MVRGFMREICRIALGCCAVVTLYGSSCCDSQDLFKQQTPVAAGGGRRRVLASLMCFLVTVRISDMILDSRIGALRPHPSDSCSETGARPADRVARSLFFSAGSGQATARLVTGAKSRVVLQGTGIGDVALG